MKRIIWVIVIVLIVAIQLVPNERPTVGENNPEDLLSNVVLSDSLKEILKTSCYDCHSNETNYPWYSYVAPVSWLVARDVREGREGLNFSMWNSKNKIQKAKILSDIVDEVSTKEMPMAIYTVMHTEAHLSQSDRELIIAWVNEYGESLFK